MLEYSFTKSVEEQFDVIAEWKLEYPTMLQKFWDGTLKKSIEDAGEKAEKVVELVGKKCPTCGEELVFKFSKAGKFIGCSWYPECKHIEQPEEEKNMLDALKAKYEWKPCPDGIAGTVVVKTWRYGPFLASSEYPAVKWIGKIKNEKEEILEELLWAAWMLVDEETGENAIKNNIQNTMPAKCHKKLIPGVNQTAIFMTIAVTKPVYSGFHFDQSISV